MARNSLAGAALTWNSNHGWKWSALSQIPAPVCGQKKRTRQLASSDEFIKQASRYVCIVHTVLHIV